MLNDAKDVARLELELAAARARLRAAEGRSVAATFLRLPDVMAAVGLSRATIYLRVKAGTFPKPVQIGARAVAWEESDIAEWQQSLPRGIKTQAV